MRDIIRFNVKSLYIQTRTCNIHNELPSIGISESNSLLFLIDQKIHVYWVYRYNIQVYLHRCNTTIQPIHQLLTIPFSDDICMKSIPSKPIKFHQLPLNRSCWGLNPILGPLCQLVSHLQGCHHVLPTIAGGLQRDVCWLLRLFGPRNVKQSSVSLRHLPSSQPLIRSVETEAVWFSESNQKTRNWF